MDHALRKHAKYGASSAHRWMVCPGSVALAESVPATPSSTYAEEGTTAHELLDVCLKNRCFDAMTGAFTYGHGFRDDEALQAGVDSVQAVLDHVLELLELWGDETILYVEQSFQFPGTVESDDTWGTNDIAIYVPSFGLLYVIDFKHGAGEVVEVKENKQLLYYGAGAVHKITTQEDKKRVNTVVLTIIQPRSVHRDGIVRRWTVGIDRLVQFVDEVDIAILATLDPKAPLIPHYSGKGQCRWCPAKLVCPALLARGLKEIKSTFATVKDVVVQGLPDVPSLPLEHIFSVLQVEPLFKSFFEDARNRAFNHIQSGGFIPGYKIVEARAARRWYGDTEAIARELMRMLKTNNWDDVYPRTLITITEAEKILKAAFRDAAPRGQKKQAAEMATQSMAILTIKESSGNLTLVETSDRRPAFNQADRMFASVQPLITAQHSTEKESI